MRVLTPVLVLSQFVQYHSCFVHFRRIEELTAGINENLKTLNDHINGFHASFPEAHSIQTVNAIIQSIEYFKIVTEQFCTIHQPVNLERWPVIENVVDSLLEIRNSANNFLKALTVLRQFYDPKILNQVGRDLGQYNLYIRESMEHIMGQAIIMSTKKSNSMLSNHDVVISHFDHV